MRYLNVEYGRWWDCAWRGTGTCWRTYNKDNTSMTSAGINQWTLNVGNGICGDPKPGCDKKAKVWIGYCIRGYCLE